MGDAVEVRSARQPALSDVPYERFTCFLRHVPPGMVVDYKQVTVGMGVAESYVRAIPRYLRRARKGNYLSIEWLIRAVG